MARTWPYNVEGFRQAAQRRLPKPVFDFVDGGAEDEETLRENHQQFQPAPLCPPTVRRRLGEGPFGDASPAAGSGCRSSSPRPA